MQIRTIDKKELHLVRALALDVWPKTFADVLTPTQIDFMMDWMYSMESLTEQVSEKGHVFLLAEENGIPVGFCSYQLDAKGNKTKIHKIYLLQETQGKGYGKQLIEEVKSIARQNKQSHVYLNVNRHNHKAIQFYLKIGLYEDFREVIDIGNGFVMDDLVMEIAI
ncbi:MAG: GNAT family N-acetyltransferase [Mongoliibacter sp.]|uniref:GNAT family N-acetyltransferase n=1 Tax=Mongoliibacter sp. TaxID=2022438 RepID=UPI0012EF52C3|nr:GNAT family N-acetyltransferase [Mongoliibacter sp.]TVP47596.1 MAG: GNAT family N-acetyltransferase [Mongoliibacter sp.]